MEMELSFLVNSRSQNVTNFWEVNAPILFIHKIANIYTAAISVNGITIALIYKPALFDKPRQDGVTRYRNGWVVSMWSEEK